MTVTRHAAASEHLPSFITAPNETDYLMVAAAVILVASVLAIGLLFLRLHTLPERLAHKTHKLQFEVVAVLGLLALFTHVHLFWVAGLLLALVDIPDIPGTFNRIAGSLEKLAGIPLGEGGAEPAEDAPDAHSPSVAPASATDVISAHAGKSGEQSHA